jgi:hypothetical protein
MDWVMQQYESAKAQFTALLYRFFALPSKIAALRQRADNLVQKAQASRDAGLISAAEDARSQVYDLQDEAAQAQGSIMDANSKINEIDSGRASDSGLGILPIAAIVAAAAVIITAVSAVVICLRKYDYLSAALLGLEQKTLTPAQYAQAVGGAGGGLFASLGTISNLLLWGGIGVVAYKFVLPALKGRKS